MFIEVLSIMAQNCKNHNRPSVAEWLNRRGYIHPMKCLVSCEKGANYWYGYQPRWISRALCWLKNANPKGHILYVPLIEHSWNCKITEMENRLAVAKGEGGLKNGVVCDYKRAVGGILWWWNYSVSLWWPHKSIYVIKLRRTKCMHIHWHRCK